MSNEEDAIDTLRYMYETIQTPLTEEATNLATSALEKQVHLKVKNNGYNIYFCPICNGSVWQIQCESKFCFRCGQALDWS